jgi:hypothetical protein
MMSPPYLLTGGHIILLENATPEPYLPTTGGWKTDLRRKDIGKGWRRHA